MDSQDLRNLQEAYMEVVMNEGLGDAKDQSDDARLQRRLSDINNSSENSIELLKQGKARWQLQRKADQAQEFLKKHPRKKRTQKEQVDLYDIILSHLLDEGYAETPEAAEAIMVNMSEEWRERFYN